MDIKAYFKGKSGKIFWANIILMGVMVIAVPMAAFYALGVFTHHGEKIEVPNVIGKSEYRATEILEEEGLRVIVADSSYSAKVAPGTVLEQTPKGGNLVKSGRIIYLTVNLNGEPMVKFPDIIENSSLREAEAQLRSLGFSLTPCERVPNRPKDFVIGVRQGMKNLYTGMMVSRDRALTILAGAGEEEPEDTIEMDMNDADVIDELDF